jgi:RNA polymerase sigma-70 factor (ECF subfamily)
MPAEVVSGASEEFIRLADPLRPELLALCYRMLGSVHDAEDQVQETLIRAWRSYGDFQGRSSLRTWLYRIAANCCLRAMESRRRRPLPSGLGEPAGTGTAGLDTQPAVTGRRLMEADWLQPFPDSVLDGSTADPAAVLMSRDSMRLALIAALQYLPGRQRAVLILRDVLGWPAAEVAGLLGTTTVAVNSSLQRAREQLRKAAPVPEELSEPDEAADRALLDRYAAAFEQADVAALTGLLTRDATFEMPPIVTWFAGRDNITRFLAARVLTEPARFRLIPVAANGQPAFAAYQRDESGRYQAHGIQVLTLAGGRIRGVVAFNDPALLACFGLPGEPPAG